MWGYRSSNGRTISVVLAFYFLALLLYCVCGWYRQHHHLSQTMSGTIRSKFDGTMKWWLGWAHVRNNSYRGVTKYWVCRYKASGCPGRLKTDMNNENEVFTSWHTCQPDADLFEAEKALEQMEDRAMGTLEEISAIIVHTDQSLCARVSLRLPQPPVLLRRLQRRRGESFGTLPEPRFIADLVIPQRYYDLPGGSSMLQYDSGGVAHDPRRRTFLLATPQTLSMLDRNREWVADGTFQMFPLKYFTQMYTIHALVRGQAILCAVALVQRKTQEVYEEILRELIFAFPPLARGPTVVHTDFEAAAIAAFKAVFPRVLHYGCFFHLSFSVRRRVAKLSLDRAYRRSALLRRCCKMMYHTAFVPVPDVPRAWDDVINSAPFRIMLQRHRAFADLVAYFHRTYISRGPGREGLFPLRLWNVYCRTLSGAPRTSNSVEGWHCGFSSRMKRNPSVKRFLIIMKLELNYATNKSIRARAGILLRRRKANDVARDRAILREVTAYNPTVNRSGYVERLCRL